MAEEALVDEGLEGVEVGVADVFGCFEGAAAAEDGEAGEEALLVVGEEVVAPFDRGAQGALSLGQVSGAAGEERQSLFEAFEDLFGVRVP